MCHKEIIIVQNFGTVPAGFVSRETDYIESSNLFPRNRKDDSQKSTSTDFELKESKEMPQYFI